MLLLPRSFKLLSAFFVIIAVGCSFPAFAEEIEEGDVVRAVDISAKEIAGKKAAVNQSVIDKFQENVDRLNDAIIQFDMLKKENERKMPSFHRFAKDVLDERVSSQFLTQDIGVNLDDMSLDISSGNLQVQNSTLEDNANPSSNLLIAGDASYNAIHDSAFCNPNSANASEVCKEQKDKSAEPSENFIDYYLSDQPWHSKKMREILLMNQRFMGGGLDKTYVIQDDANPKEFVATLSILSKGNLRAAIRNELAASRAPTSQATGGVMDLLFRSVGSTGQVTPVDDYKVFCSNKDNIKDLPALTYACSMTAQVGDANLTSQTSIDKAFQYDYMLSGEFYNSINKAEVHGQLDKEQVWLKAQQVAQDYKALRLLQMKTAMMAVNMMNGR